LKLLEATCENQTVTAEEITVECDILSQGNKSSTGVVLLDGSEVKYITSNASDIKDLITSLVSIIEQIVTIATGLDTASNSPGGQTSNISQLTTLKTQLNATKDTLK
jgi:hypothetical protein